MNIFYGFHGVDLFNGFDNIDLYDTASSAAKFAMLVKAKIKGAYPKADVEVDYDLNATGVLPYPLQAKINGWTGAEMSNDEIYVLDHIENVANDVFIDDDWAVTIENGLKWICPHCKEKNVDVMEYTAVPTCVGCLRDVDWVEIVER